MNGKRSEAAKIECEEVPRRKPFVRKTIADAIMEGRAGDSETFDRLNYLRSQSDGYDYRGGP
jgi:hypothetical protein